MASIGEQFRTAREAKGVNQTDAGAATKILTKVIAAMEEDDFSVMPAPTYAKGFIRLYAEYLGLDPVPLVEEYSARHGGAPRRLIDENSQLEQNTQDSRVFPSRPKGGGTKLFAWLAPLGDLLSGAFRKIPTGPFKDVRILAGAIAALLVLAVFIGSMTNCSRKKAAEKPDTPDIAPAHSLLDEPLPDLYLTAPGKIESN